jgi:hypothetical protein
MSNDFSEDTLVDKAQTLSHLWLLKLRCGWLHGPVRAFRGYTYLCSVRTMPPETKVVMLARTRGKVKPPG